MSNASEAWAWPDISLHVKALRASGLLHSAHHEKFDPYISLVRRLLNVPVAVISLIETDRQIFAGHQGLPKQWAERGETPLTHSFCQHVVARDEVLRVADARAHPVLKDNLAINDLGVIAYLGVPLKLPTGETVGALAAIDGQPREWTDTELQDLQLAASLVIDKIATSVADARWHTTFEQLREGIVMGEVVRDQSGSVVDWRYLQVNKAWGELVGVDPQSVVGRTVREVIPGIEDEWISEFAQVVETGQPINFTRQVGSLDRWYDGYAQATGPDTFTVLFVEVTERVRAQQAVAATQEFSHRRQAALIEIGDRLRIGTDIDTMVESSGEALGKALGASRVGYGTVDASAETIEVYRDWHVNHLEGVAGMHRFGDYGTYIEDLKRGDDVIILDVATDSRTRNNVPQLENLGIRVLVNIPLLEAGRLIGVMLVHFDQRVPFGSTEANFVRAVADRTHAAIRQAQTIAADRLREAEIGHRLKNTMAVVQAIATQTLRGDDIEERRAAFTGRLAAISNAHDILMNRTWEGASLRKTLMSALEPHGAEDRISLKGSDVDLDARQAMSMSLAVHELATNATKYGALSVPTGTIEIEWSVTCNDDKALQFRWSWREIGGPTVVEPRRKGFGSRLVTRVLPNDFGGSVSIQYLPQGICCNLITSASNLGLDQDVSDGSEANA